MELFKVLMQSLVLIAGIFIYVFYAIDLVESWMLQGFFSRESRFGHLFEEVFQ